MNNITLCVGKVSPC